jgi:sugar lactone lactonase YvrE
MSTACRFAVVFCCLLGTELLVCRFDKTCRADLWGISVDPTGQGVPASNYDKVFHFDNTGHKLPVEIPSGSAGLDYASGIAVGPDGNIYVSSVNTGSVYYYDGQTGAPLPSPIPAAPAGLFAFLQTAAPAQLAFGPSGNLYVSEFFGPNVRVYDAHPGPAFGQQLANAATGLTSAGGLAFLSNGDLLVGNGFVMGAGRTAKITRVHNGVQSDFGFSEGAVFAPGSILALEDDSVLVVDLLGNYVAKFDSTGNPLGLFAFIPPPVAPPATNFPSDIKFDQDGNLIVSVLGPTNPSSNPADNQGALWRYDRSGNIIDPDNDATPNEPIVSLIEPIGGIAWTPSLKTLAGDFNGDNAVGPADYAKWRSDFGKFVAKGNGADGNNNGVVDAADYVVWRNAATPGFSAAVPEPTTLAIVFGGLLAVISTRSRHRTCRAPTK